MLNIAPKKSVRLRTKWDAICCTMALGSTQPLIEMNTRCIS